jgi:hypothetical protein
MPLYCCTCKYNHDDDDDIEESLFKLNAQKKENKSLEKIRNATKELEKIINKVDKACKSQAKVNIYKTNCRYCEAEEEQEMWNLYEINHRNYIYCQDKYNTQSNTSRREKYYDDNLKYEFRPPWLSTPYSSIYPWRHLKINKSYLC